MNDLPRLKKWKLNDSVSPEQIPKSDVCGGIKDKNEAKRTIVLI